MTLLLRQKSHSPTNFTSAEHAMRRDLSEELSINPHRLNDLAKSPHQNPPPSQEHPASTSLHRPTNRARANSITPTIIRPERVFAIASDDTIHTSVRTSRTRVGAVSGDDLSQAAVGGDFEGLEAGHPGGAGVVPDVDVGLRVARAVGAAVEGHYRRVGCEGWGEEGEEGGFGVHCFGCVVIFDADVSACVSQVWRKRFARDQGQETVLI